MSYDDHEAEDKAEDARTAARLLTEGWQLIPEGTVGLPVGCLPGGYYPRPSDPRGGAVVLQGNDGGWWTYGYAHLIDGELHGLELEDDGGDLASCASNARTWRPYPARKLWKPKRGK